MPEDHPEDRICISDCLARGYRCLIRYFALICRASLQIHLHEKVWNAAVGCECNPVCTAKIFFFSLINQCWKHLIFFPFSPSLSRPNTSILDSGFRSLLYRVIQYLLCVVGWTLCPWSWKALPAGSSWRLQNAPGARRGKTQVFPRLFCQMQPQCPCHDTLPPGSARYYFRYVHSGAGGTNTSKTKNKKNLHTKTTKQKKNRPQAKHNSYVYHDYQRKERRFQLDVILHLL